MNATKLVDEVRRAQLPPVGERRRIREAAKLTLKDLAIALGVSIPTIYYWETGEREPRRQRAIAYAELLHQLEEAVAS